MKEMIHDLLYFLEDHWEMTAARTNGTDGRITYSGVEPYWLDTVAGNITIEQTKEMALEWSGELRSVLNTLDKKRPKLKYFKRDGMRVWCRDEIWESLAQIDDACYLLIDLDSDAHRPRYRVFGPRHCVACDDFAAANAALRPFKFAGTTVRGAVMERGHYACLFPIDKQPNFAGESALPTWD